MEGVGRDRPNYHVVCPNKVSEKELDPIEKEPRFHCHQQNLVVETLTAESKTRLEDKFHRRRSSEIGVMLILLVIVRTIRSSLYDCFGLCLS